MPRKKKIEEVEAEVETRTPAEEELVPAAPNIPGEPSEQERVSYGQNP